MQRSIEKEKNQLWDEHGGQFRSNSDYYNVTECDYSWGLGW
jgi:hypothetical protein